LPLIAALIYILYNAGLVPAAWFTNNLVLAFLAALALLWSLVLADRINLLRAETQSANRSLARSERQYRSLFQDSLDAVFITTREGKIVDLNPAGLTLLGYARGDLAQLDARDLFETRADYVRLQKMMDEQGYVVDHETHLRCREGSIISAIVSGTRWQDEEHGLSGYQGIFRDVTEHRRTQQELATYRLHLEELVAARTMQAEAELAERRRTEAALERRVQELSALSEIAKTISTVTDLMPALNLVAERVTRLFDVASTAIGEMDHATRTMRLLASYPPSPQGASLVGSSWFWDTVALLQKILQLDGPLIIEDPQSDPLLGSARELAVQYDVTGLMLVPLRVGGAVNGVLVLSARGEEPFRKEGVLDLAETIAGSIANAIENTRLYQQAQAPAVAHERQRLARELHDSVTQLLYSIVLLAEGRRMEAEQADLDSKTLEQSFNELGELGQQALGEMRLLLYQLRAPVLKEMGLSGALQQRLNAVEQRVGIQTYLYTNGDLETLPLLVQEELYFIAQEALNNALRHARASEIQVRLVKQDRHVELVVQDNGTGFEMDTTSEGMGLRNMHARAQLIDARLEIHTWIGKGTRVQLHMKFESYAPSEAAYALDERE
jgi:PAS domain S-box-containing protein